MINKLIKLFIITIFAINILHFLGIIDLFTDRYIIVIILCLFFAIFLYGIINAIKETKKRKETQKLILQEIVPKKAIIVDILVYKHFYRIRKSYRARFHFYPIIKDLQTNHLYVSLGKYNYGKYNYTYSTSAFSSLKFQLKSAKGKDVNIGNNATYYIKKELEKFNIKDTTLIFDNIQYKYYGKIGDSKIISQNGNNLIFNVSQDNFLELLKNTTPFEGVLDFDE